jgi:biotin carboxylase
VSASRVIVVGTTSDYIDLLARRFPGRALFLTGWAERAAAREPEPDDASEALCELPDPQDALAALRAHLCWCGIEPSGVACFDDESMALAATIADELGLPYASAEAVAACRSKLETKRRWQAAALPCPRTALVRNEGEARAMLRSLGRPIVLKPLTGSGSELTFACRTEAECSQAFAQVAEGLRDHPNARMYSAGEPRETLVAEELVEGTELSCDVLIDGARAEIVRLASKLPAPDQSFGTTLAYVVPAELPDGIRPAALASQLREAARAVGIDRGLCMVDMIVRDDEALMLEIAPRPGGDCLPFLIRRSSGLDMLGLALDVAEGRAVSLPTASAWRRLVGLRLIASRSGLIEAIDTRALEAEPAVREVALKHGPGHRVLLPPHDYDSRILGHVLFEPDGAADLPAACAALAAKLSIRMADAPCPIPC